LKNHIKKLNLDELIIQALKEDITSEDITTNAIIPEGKTGEVQLLAKENGIIAGLTVFKRVFELLDERVEMNVFFKDGDAIKENDLIGVIIGDVRVLLSGERVALNYLQRMSGIATHTRKLSKVLIGTQTKLLDTRKTTPNMRIFEKYAVKVGGGYNHRFNLSDGVLIKDNHINAAGGIKEAVELTQLYVSFVRKIEIEVENLEMVSEALEAGADIIMLDNMDNDTIIQAVKIIERKAQIECSGNITEQRLKEIAKLGVDFVSCGALTHSSSVLDISMKNLKIL
jgi:nicotinate-nucleotide pyrophosphorylase (carboxylating)